MKCPGQDCRYWRFDAIYEAECPDCGSKVEFFKDEPTRRCKQCGKRLINPRMDFGCAAYCPYAEQCLGDLPPELGVQRQDLFKERVAVAMKRAFGQDFKRIGHAIKVARYAEEINREERGTPVVVISAAYLHDIGIKEAERKHQSTAPKYQCEEGPPVAREILTKLGAGEELVEEVCDIIGHHHDPRPDETVNFKVVYDADQIVNLEEKCKNGELQDGGGQLKDIIDSTLLTGTGRQVARKVLMALREGGDECG